MPWFPGNDNQISLFSFFVQFYSSLKNHNIEQISTLFLHQPVHTKWIRTVSKSNTRLPEIGSNHSLKKIKHTQESKPLKLNLSSLQQTQIVGERNNHGLVFASAIQKKKSIRIRIICNPKWIATLITYMALQFVIIRC
jgi:hypothetical protein